MRQVGPAVGFYGVFFAVPLLILFLYSFWTMNGFVIVPGFTVANYVEGLTTSLYVAVLLRTVLVGLIAASVVVPIVYVLAYLMLFVFERRTRQIFDLVLVSMFSGYLVRIYAWRTILGKEGLLNSALITLHLTDTPLTFLLFSPFAVIVTLVGLLIPLALLPIYSSMSNVSKEHLEGARDLGSTGFTLHRTILIPMTLPGLNTAFAIAFIISVGDFVVPAMVGGAQGVMVGNVIADQFKGIGSNWPLGAALAFLIMGIVIAAYIVVVRAIKWMTSW